MWKTVLFLTGSLLAAVIYLMLPKKHCVCGVKIPEFGGMCECGEYNSRMLTQEVLTQEVLTQEVVVKREQELRRVEEERKKGNDYDTFL